MTWSVGARGSAGQARLRLIDDDTNAFTAYMEARRLPNGTPAEKSARDVAMQAGLKLAVEVPWSTAKACYEAMEASESAMHHGNIASITDTMVGFTLAFAGVRGGIWNVLINLKDLTDAAYVARMKDECAQLLAKAQTLLDRAAAHGDAQLEAMLAKR